MNAMKHDLRISRFEMSKSRSLMGAVVTAVALVFCMPAVAYAQGTWTGLAPIPDPLGPEAGFTEGAAVSGVGDFIVVSAGWDNGTGDTNLTRIYDILTDAWSFGPTTPVVAAEPAYGATGHGGKIYVIGGRTGGSGDAVQQYNVATQTWALKAPMPTARSAAAVVVMGDSLYVLGGRTSAAPCSGGALSVMERYDIDTDTWTTEASLPSPRSDFAAVAVGNKIYVFGGCDGGDLNDVDVYDRSTGTWDTSPADLSVARSSLMAGRKGNVIYVMGGRVAGVVSALNESYNTVKDTWSVGAPMPDVGCVVPGKGETGVYSHGGQIYVPGGGCPAFGTGTNTLWVFNP